MTSKKEGQEQSLCLDYTYFDDGKHRSVEGRALSCVKYVVGSMVGSMVGSLVGSMVHLERGLRWRHSMFRHTHSTEGPKRSATRTVQCAIREFTKDPAKSHDRSGHER
jgi:hypothetical protein